MRVNTVQKMAVSIPVIMQPFFLDVSGRSCFCLYHPPVRVDAVARGAIVYIHPFAEEMNFSRHMAALQARALEALGVERLHLLPFDFSMASMSSAGPPQ